MSYIGGNKDEFGGGLVIKTKNKNKSFIYNTTFSNSEHVLMESSFSCFFNV